MGLESVLASEDVIGDLPSPWATIIVLMAIQGTGEGEGGYTSRVGYFHVSVRVFNKVYGGKGCILKNKETRARLDRNEVREEEKSKWMGRQTKKSVGCLPTEYQGL